MRLKPSGLRYLDIARNFNADCGFILCGVYIPVFLCGFAVLLCYSVRCLVFIYRYFCAVFRCSYPLTPPLFRLLSDLKFYYMYVKVSCKGSDTEADLSVLIHATLISST